MVSLDGDRPRLKLVDFNIACNYSEDDGLIRGGHGLRNWSAPETRQNLTYTSKSDLWTIGCVIVFMCTGQKPFADGVLGTESLCLENATKRFRKETDVALLRDLLSKLIK